jgi:hypothetical protein
MAQWSTESTGLIKPGLLVPRWVAKIKMAEGIQSNLIMIIGFAMSGGGESGQGCGGVCIRAVAPWLCSPVRATRRLRWLFLKVVFSYEGGGARGTHPGDPRKVATTGNRRAMAAGCFKPWRRQERAPRDEMGREIAQWVRHYVSKLNVESVWLRSSCTGTAVKRAKPRVWTLKSSKSRNIADLFIGLFGPLCTQQGV